MSAAQPSPILICTVTNDLTYDQRMIRICDSLAQRGYRVQLVGRQLPDSIELVERNYQQKRLRCWFLRGKLFYLEYNLRLLWWLLLQRFDLICSVDLDTLAPGYLVSRIKGKRCIYDAHEYFTELPEVIYRPLTRWIWRLLARLIIPRVDHAYTVGAQLAELFAERYRRDFGVIRNLPYCRTDTVQSPADGPFVLLYQGRLNVGRGLETALLALPDIPGAELWLAGEGDLSQQLRQLAEELKLAHRVRFLGYLPPEELAMVTLQAHLGINLLENKGLSYYYSLANKAFDYIQVGLPSIQMDFPEYQALQDDYGVFYLLHDLSPVALAKAVNELIDNPQSWAALHRNCLQARQELCWEQEERRLWDIYDDMNK